jgi:hypothetical protein
MSTRPFSAALVACVAILLTACSPAPAPSASPQSDEAPAAPVLQADETTTQDSPTPSVDPDSCDATGWTTAGADQRTAFPVRDRGARDLAAGTVGTDDAGAIVTYVVAPGDALNAIGARLCINNALSLAALNHTATVHPGQVLRIFRDASLPEVPYFNPQDAPAGFQQIPYQSTLEKMGRAADAGDVAAVRSMWSHTLSGMFYNPELVARIQQLVDAGNPKVLQQLFS